MSCALTIKVSLQQIQGPVENGLPASTSSSSVIDYFPHFPFINFCSTPPTSAEEPKPVVLKKPDTPKRKVLFNFVISVILIPTRTEFYEAGLDNDMWWCSLDFEDFKRSAVLEIREFMKGTASTALVAMKALYQPNPNMETVLETATSIDSPYYADNPNPTA